MQANGAAAQPVTVVVGANATGSAIAHRLHGAGWSVVLIDDVDPAWTRRGQAYTDAWYVGVAELAGTPAVFCASVRSIPAALDRGRAIAATTWSAGGVATAVQPLAVVDARGAELGGPELGAVTIQRTDDPEVRAAPWRIDVAAAPVTFVVRSPQGGHFRTHRSIGEVVAAGELLGAVAGNAVVAAASGRIVGLSARGARVGRNAPVAEIDAEAAREDCFGLGPIASAAARDVLDCLARACAS